MPGKGRDLFKVGSTLFDTLFYFEKYAYFLFRSDFRELTVNKQRIEVLYKCFTFISNLVKMWKFWPFWISPFFLQSPKVWTIFEKNHEDLAAKNISWRKRNNFYMELSIFQLHTYSRSVIPAQNVRRIFIFVDEKLNKIFRNMESRKVNTFLKKSVWIWMPS